MTWKPSREQTAVQGSWMECDLNEPAKLHITTNQIPKPLPLRRAQRDFLKSISSLIATHNSSHILIIIASVESNQRLRENTWMGFTGTESWRVSSFALAASVIPPPGINKTFPVIYWSYFFSKKWIRPLHQFKTLSNLFKTKSQGHTVSIGLILSVQYKVRSIPFVRNTYGTWSFPAQLHSEPLLHDCDLDTLRTKR